MLLYRITSAEYAADLSGTGAFLYGGRWNSKGVRLLYTAESSALAMLEALAHFTMLPQKRSYVKLTIDVSNLIEQWQKTADAAWYKTVAAAELGNNWQLSAQLSVTRQIGDSFVKEGFFPGLKVPSALEPDSHNFLLNPGHALFAAMRVIKTTPVSFDQRLVNR
ncbi:MAG: RES family NAD+ phosphorylase [Chitinophagaceae bacterium]|nr:RES family NAD+ phosphorylase [Chitinophagaceae bacterium]